MAEQGYTVAGAARALGVSEKTIRRYIKAGRLKVRLVPGPRGQEYRIEDLEPRSAATSAPGPAGAALVSAPTPAAVARLERLLTEREERLRTLEEERARLLSRVGFLEGQLAQAEKQIRFLISAPTNQKEEKSHPWWWPF